MPPVVIVAIPVDAELQLPPIVASLSVVVDPTQVVAMPVIFAAIGAGLIVRLLVMKDVPHRLVTE